MTAPANGVSLANVVEKLVERDHYMDQHRDPDTGEQSRFLDCPSEPCITWRQWLVDSGWAG